MKKYLFVVVIFSFIGMGCFHHKPEDVMGHAHQLYETTIYRYSDIIDSCNDDHAVEQLRLLGHERALSFGSALWQSLWGNDHLVNSRGVPLHKSVYFIESDIEDLESILHKLEQFGLFPKPIYAKIQELRLELMNLLRLVKAQKEYSEESQYIEQRHFQKAQYAQQQKQTELLRDISKKPKVTTHKSNSSTVNIFIDKRSL